MIRRVVQAVRRMLRRERIERPVHGRPRGHETRVNGVPTQHEDPVIERIYPDGTAIDKRGRRVDHGDIP